MLVVASGDDDWCYGHDDAQHYKPVLKRRVLRGGQVFREWQVGGVHQKPVREVEQRLGGKLADHPGPVDLADDIPEFLVKVRIRLDCIGCLFDQFSLLRSLRHQGRVNLLPSVGPGENVSL